MRAKRHQRSGQGMTEYLIIVALIAISSIVIIKTTSNSIKVGFGRVASALQGTKYSRSNYERVTSSKTQAKSFEDFDEDAQ
ncbi:MAG: hypothetical protein R3A11_03110 [Bdellovibrionota bacterium]